MPALLRYNVSISGPILFGLYRVGALGEGMPAITRINGSISPGPILFGLYRVDALGEGMPACTLIHSLYFPQVLSCLVYTELMPWGRDASYYSDTMSLFPPGPILFGLYRVDALGEGMPDHSDIRVIAGISSPRALSL